MIELETLEERAANGIREYLKSKNPYEFQDLVASLLKAMGYYIQSVAWQEYYDKMSDEDKNMLPLKRIAFLGNNE